MQKPITPITCYHDGACPLCRLEIRAMQRLDVRQAIHWVDISQDRNALEQAGLSYEQTMRQLHVVDGGQQLQTGVYGFLTLWEQLPYYRRMAVVVRKTPGLLPALAWGYRLFARHRLWLTGRTTKGMQGV